MAQPGLSVRLQELRQLYNIQILTVETWRSLSIRPVVLMICVSCIHNKIVILLSQSLQACYHVTKRPGLLRLSLW